MNEVTKESDESSEPVTPTTKSIRDRINSKFRKRKESRKRIKEVSIYCTYLITDFQIGIAINLYYFSTFIINLYYFSTF